MTPQQKIVTCAKCGQKMAIPPGYENTPGRCTKCGAVVNQPNRGQAPTAQQQAPPVQQQAPRAQQQAPPLPGLGPSPLDGEPIRLDQSILDDAPIQLNQSLLDGEPIQFQAPGGEDEGAPVQLADSLLEEIPMGVPRMSEVSKAEKKKFEKGELPRKLFFVALWTVGITIVCTLAVSGLMMIIGGQSESSARFLSGMDIGLFVGVMIGSIWGVVRVFEPSVYIAPVFGGALGFVFTVIYHVLEEKFVAPSDHSLMVIATIGTCGGAFFGFFSDRFREYLEER